MQEKQNILIVDDSELNREMLMEILGDEYGFIQAGDGVQAVELLRQRSDFDLILLDVRMPRMDGFGVMEIMNQYHWIEDVPVIMISAEDVEPFIERAYDLGASDYIRRPFDSRIVRRRVSNTLMLYAKQRRLKNMVAEQIYEKEKNGNLMISILSHIVEFRNGESGQHVLHIRTITDLLLRELTRKTKRYHLSEQDIALICTASALHDIGKISIPEEIINKPGRLTAEEYATMKTHTTIGASILSDLPFNRKEPLVKTAYEICRWHHERWDGGGYPDGLKGENIPISAQVVALADVYDALTSERCYKKAFDHDTALHMILNGECGAFNPLLLKCLTEMSEVIRQTMQHDSTIEYNYQREARRLADEALQKEDPEWGGRASRMLELEKIRAEFFASHCVGLQFEYDDLSGKFHVTDRSGDEPQRWTVDIRGGENMHIITLRDFNRLMEELRKTSPDKPEATLMMMMPVGMNYRWHRLDAVSLWSQGAAPRYLGAVGILTDVHEQYIHQNQKKAEQGAIGHGAMTELVRRNLEEIFDVVRIVDPDRSQILGVDKQGHVFETGERCHAAWNRDMKCSNCIAGQVMHDHGKLSKLEFSDDDIFHVIAKYGIIDGRPCVLEMVSRMNNGRWIDADGKRLLIDRMQGSGGRAAYTDPLTGAFSRAYYEENRTQLEGMDGVAILDVDDFKSINDTYGHQVGDKALRAIAHAILSCVRSTDVLIRYGGDEFLMLFPKIPEEIFFQRLEKIRTAVRDTEIPEYPELKLSISVGGAYGAEPLAEAIRQADRLMYRAKAQKHQNRQ